MDDVRVRCLVDTHGGRNSGGSVTEAPWKEFEKLAYEIQRELAGSAQVTLRDTIQGAESGIPRQIDISVRQPVGPHSILIVVDCKAHKDPIDINIVEQFATTVRDVRANKGALIASHGFTQAALTMARAKGLDTFNLVDTARTKWRAYVSIPALLHRTYLSRASFRFAGTSRGGAPFPAGDPSLWEVHASDGTNLGIVRDLLLQKWNAREVPKEPGRHEVVLAVDAKLRDADEDLATTISATVEVGHEFYFGHVPIQTRGFQDVQTGGLITREITTKMMSPSDIERGLVPGWQKIDDPAALAVRPHFRLDYSDVLPVSTELEGSS